MKADSVELCVEYLCQVSRVADAEETFDDVSKYVSLMIGTEQHLSLWQMCSALSKPDVEMPDMERKQDLPVCPVVSVYGMSCLPVACKLFLLYYCVFSKKQQFLLLA